MGRKDRIKEERIRYWIKFLSVFFVLSIACLIVIFYIYNRNIMKESNMKLDELASIERIVLNDNINDDIGSESYDEIVDVAISDDKTINDVTNTLTTNVLAANIVSNKEEKENEKEHEKIENKENKENKEREEVELSKINALNNEIENNAVQNEIKTEEVAALENNVSNPVVEELKFESPLSGEIIKDYAKDTLVYSNTLEEWCVHLGVDIKAPKTTVIKAAEKGIIEKITIDPRYGNSITINHGSGFKTVYSSLLVSDFFNVGEEVQKGDNIGTVGDSANFEKADDAHLHFEMYKDGENVNPTIYLK